MADIKQAAEWLKSGARVRRSGWRVRYGAGTGYWKIKLIEEDESEQDAYFWPVDLLAEDWEIAE